MSIFLVGGGSLDASHPYVREFAEEARRRAAARGDAQAVVALFAAGEDGIGMAPRFERALLGAGVDRVERIDSPTDDADELVPGTEIDLARFSTTHGLLVAGGLAPVYLAALEPVAHDMRRLVAEGVPYLGYSAGAAIVADRAITGGWRIGGVPVAPEDSSDGYDEVGLDAGLGLLDVSIEVHAVQWGLLARAVALTEAGAIQGALAIDERTALVIGEGALRVLGEGSVWRVLPGEAGVAVASMRVGGNA